MQLTGVDHRLDDALIGIAVVVVEAKNAEVAGFYRRFGFVALEPGGLRLCLLVYTLHSA